MSESKNEASIASIPFFKSLPPSDLMAILGITSSKIIATGENLFDQKDPSDGLYVLLSGKLQIYISSADSQAAPQKF